MEKFATNELINSRITQIGRRHLINLWLTIPVITMIIAGIIVILLEYDPNFSIKNPSSVLGITLIFIGSLFLMLYNYLSRIPLKKTSGITQSTKTYLAMIKKQIYTKKITLLFTSLGFCILLSMGIHLLVFHFFTGGLLMGVIFLYYGVFAGVYCYMLSITTTRINSEYGPILKKIKEVIALDKQ